MTRRSCSSSRPSSFHSRVARLVVEPRLEPVALVRDRRRVAPLDGRDEPGHAPSIRITGATMLPARRALVRVALPPLT